MSGARAVVDQRVSTGDDPPNEHGGSARERILHAPVIHALTHRGARGASFESYAYQEERGDTDLQHDPCRLTDRA